MNNDPIIFGILYVAGIWIFWGLVVGLIFTIIKFIRRKNQRDKEILHKLDQIIQLLQEKK